MSLELGNYEAKAREAVKLFWRTRGKARSKQAKAGTQDMGERGSVTGGKNMDGFQDIFSPLVTANGLESAEICLKRRVLTLPGYYRPTKLWDLLVMHNGDLIAALEFKSHIGPSISKNFNNRCEEAIGSAHDFWTAYREGAFGAGAPRPFLGWILLLEDFEETQRPVEGMPIPRFPMDPEFINASYAKRYDITCRRLVQENLYASAALLTSPREAITDGQYDELSEITSLNTIVAQFAAHVASFAAKKSIGV